MGGCTDPDLIAYAPRVLYPYRPSVVIMQTGSNDIAAGIPLDEILRRKEEMYALFRRELPETEFIVCSGLPLPGRMQFWEATVKTNALLRELCARTEGLHFLDATDAMLADTGDEMYRTSDGRYFNPSLFRIDRIHLNKKGHDVWTGLMKEKLAELGV
jgi:lysophospholipase L1-like esterase